MKTYLPRKRCDFQIIDNIQDLCRLCLKQCENGVPIYPYADSDAQPILATKIMMCVGIEVPKNEDLSNQVCLHCIGEINTSLAFRKVCENSYQRMKLHLQALQQLKYYKCATKEKMLPKESEAIEEICKENAKTTENVQNKSLVPFQDVIPDTIKQETIEPEKQTVLFEQNVSADESKDPYQNTFLDPNTGRLEIIEDHESHENLDNLEIIDPDFESHQNNIDLEIISSKYMDVKTNNANKNYMDVSKRNEIIENNAIATNAELPDNCRNISDTNYLKQVFMAAPSFNQNDGSNRIYLIKAKETVDSADIDSTSNLNDQTQNNFEGHNQNHDESVDCQSQEEKKTNITEVMSEFILSRLLESGLIQMEGDAIATCDIGSMQLETSNGDVITMEIVEEGSRKTKKSVRRKEPEAHTCGTCGLVLKSAASLRRHEDNHSGVRLYQCDVCSRSFAQPYTLQRHVTTHHAVRPFACTLCPASFSQGYALKTHARSHARDESLTLHKCHMCDAAYTHASGLRRHIRTRHIGSKVECPNCSKALSDASSLKRHQLKCFKRHTAQKLLHLESLQNQQDVNLDPSQI